MSLGPVLVTLRELRAALAWVEEHVQEEHAGKLEYADISIRHLDSCGIGQRTIVTCEACERNGVKNANHRDVTDYDAW